jgi:carbamoyltransferase
MPQFILGISAYYHDSAACLLRDGDIVAAAQEERFTRKKQDARFPANAIRYCMTQTAAVRGQISHVAFYEKPLVKFERLLETYLSYAPRGFQSFVTAMPVWLKEKLFLQSTLRKELRAVFGCSVAELPPLLFAEHHQSHAASAFFASPYDRAAVLCMDGVGEWATTSTLWQIDFPHSLGLLYSAFTHFTGFKVNSGEYKLMGLAPYGEPRYVDAIFGELVDLKDDGSFHLNMEYFDYCTGLTMTNPRFHALFGGPPRVQEGPVTQREMDLASSIQVVTEEVVLRLAHTLHDQTNARFLCLAGGVALNCVANGRLLREGPFEGLWIQPAAGDAGGAVGAALATWHQYLDRPRTLNGADLMHGSYLGPSVADGEIQHYLDGAGAVYQRFETPELLERTATLLAEEKVVGWFHGRMEFGPRALGGRSILGDSRSPRMQSVMNLKIKCRESFRPFGPSVLAEAASEYFDLDCASPYMLLVAQVQPAKRRAVESGGETVFGIDRLKQLRSVIPAVTHVDWSARIQTVHRETNPRYYELIERFAARTGCPLLVNTSFNVRGEPIVCSPADAYRCFMRTQIDALVLENFLLLKEAQPPWQEAGEWRKELELD